MTREDEMRERMLASDPNPARWKPRDCPGHEPTLAGLMQIMQGREARCCHCGIPLNAERLGIPEEQLRR